MTDFVNGLKSLSGTRAITPEASDFLHDAAEEIERLRAALVEIRDHWANQYDHPRKDAEMYRGPYGIGVTDGHRACAIIATKALPSDQRGTQ